MSQNHLRKHWIEKRIYLLRGEKVMLSPDLASIYQIETKVLIQSIKRNADRFPSDFMFQLNEDEYANLKSQFVASSWGGVRKKPYAFTEQGIAMLSSVLRSPMAVQINIEIMRTFVGLRKFLISHKELASKLQEIERKYDSQFKVVFDSLRGLINPGAATKRRIGIRNANDSDP